MVVFCVGLREARTSMAASSSGFGCRERGVGCDEDRARTCFHSETGGATTAGGIDDVVGRVVAGEFPDVAFGLGGTAGTLAPDNDWD